MEDEGVADWTLNREELKFNFSKKQRLIKGDVAWLMRVKSRLDFESEEDQVDYCKRKLKDLANNHK